SPPRDAPPVAEPSEPPPPPRRGSERPPPGAYQPPVVGPVYQPPLSGCGVVEELVTGCDPS
ncbi:MAG: PH domain-containing protein, partial [Thermoleophilaceae bacterium]